MEYTAHIPADLASELQAAGLARPIPQVRSAGPLLADLIIAAGNAATIVTLIGTPIGTKSISENITHWLRHRRTESGVRVKMSVQGRHGRVEMEIDDSTAAADVASTISDLIKALDAK
jgi:hypothetical protein